VLLVLVSLLIVVIHRQLLNYSYNVAILFILLFQFNFLHYLLKILYLALKLLVINKHRTDLDEYFTYYLCNICSLRTQN